MPTPEEEFDRRYQWVPEETVNEFSTRAARISSLTVLTGAVIGAIDLLHGVNNGFGAGDVVLELGSAATVAGGIKLGRMIKNI